MAPPQASAACYAIQELISHILTTKGVCLQLAHGPAKTSDYRPASCLCTVVLRKDDVDDRADKDQWWVKLEA